MRDALSRLRNTWPDPITREERLAFADELEASRREVAALREALRSRVIKNINRMEPTIPHGDDGIAAKALCQLCGELWIVGMGERHAENCLAALVEGTTAGERTL